MAQLTRKKCRPAGYADYADLQESRKAGELSSGRASLATFFYKSIKLNYCADVEGDDCIEYHGILAYATLS